MDHLCRIYKDVLSPEVCKGMIEKFENHPEQYERHHKGKMSFSQIKLQHHKEWGEEVNILIKTYLEYIKEYKKTCLSGDYQWPKKYGFEEIRMKKYLPYVDEFGDHVDVSNHENARRFLAFFIYLDSNEEGQTAFRIKDIHWYSECIQGNLLMFPPMWPWIHAGRKPIKVPKYIVGSYLHYV